ncbi:MAG: AMP-binding protein, partial [Methanobrevibacter sp.]|nr:AMP-binding protein [Methanobrevibacter sp.]
MSIVSDEERNVILNEFNDTNVYYPRDMTVVDLFEKAVKENTNNIALTFEGESLTYGELNQRINAFAHNVEKQISLDNDDFIAIIANRSIESIMGIYAILKLGAAYVPIDPKYPKERIKYILGDCRPKAIFTYDYDLTQIENIFSDLEYNVPIFDLGDEYNYEGDVSNLNVPISSSSLAYCIYTSGTTGHPKGVMIEHKSVVNLNNFNKNNLNVSSSDNILQFAPLIFDVSVWEIFAAHLNGANLVIRKEDLTDFENWFDENEISVTTLPPNFLELNMNIKPRILMTAGSPSNLSIVENNVADEYINAYGPTESTVYTTEWIKPKDFNSKSNIVPIGKPLNNIKTYIIDKNINLCPIGIIGELAIAGEG